VRLQFIETFYFDRHKKLDARRFPAQSDSVAQKSRLGDIGSSQFTIPKSIARSDSIRIELDLELTKESLSPELGLAPGGNPSDNHHATEDSATNGCQKKVSFGEESGANGANKNAKDNAMLLFHPAAKLLDGLV